MSLLASKIDDRVQTQIVVSSVTARLDAIMGDMTLANAQNTAKSLVEFLADLRDEVGPNRFTVEAVPAVRRHPIAAAIHQDPFTLHSFSQPRGYPGDADLLDLIYRHDAASPTMAAASALGIEISKYCLDVPACKAVRERRELLATRIDEVAYSRPNAEIFSLACGHLREAELSLAVRNKQIARFVAGDQDDRSLEVVVSGLGKDHPFIKAECIRVRDVLTEKSHMGQFDFVYAAGLYDYLDQNVSAVLTEKLFRLLKPKGRLLIGNYLTGIFETGYMEAFMAWSLIFRTAEQITAFASKIDQTQIVDLTYFNDQSGCVGYLEIEKC